MYCSREHFVKFRTRIILFAEKSGHYECMKYGVKSCLNHYFNSTNVEIILLNVAMINFQLLGIAIVLVRLLLPCLIPPRAHASVFIG